MDSFANTISDLKLDSIARNSKSKDKQFEPQGICRLLSVWASNTQTFLRICGEDIARKKADIMN